MKHAAAILALLAIAPAEPVAAQYRSTDCELTLASAGIKPKFGAYPARAYEAAPARLQLRTSRDRTYRGRLRWTAENGPRFAGHYAVGVWGCGAGCRQLAFVDVKTGRVHWDPAVSYYGAELSGDDPDTYQFALTFRTNSRLIGFAGKPLKDMSGEPDWAHAGVSLYEWRGDRLHLLRFVPLARLCHRNADGDWEK